MQWKLMIFSLSLLSFSLTINLTTMYFSFISFLFSSLTPSHSVPRPPFLSSHLSHLHVPQSFLLVHSRTPAPNIPNSLFSARIYNLRHSLFLCSRFSFVSRLAHPPDPPIRTFAIANEPYAFQRELQRD